MHRTILTLFLAACGPELDLQPETPTETLACATESPVIGGPADPVDLPPGGRIDQAHDLLRPPTPGRPGRPVAAPDAIERQQRWLEALDEPGAPEPGTEAYRALKRRMTEAWKGDDPDQGG